MKSQTVSLPIADTFVSVKIGDTVQACLRTKEAAEARTRHAVADGALKRFWEPQKAGPAHLSHKQAVALAGVLFWEFTQAHDEDPGEAERWLIEHRDDVLARYGRLGRAGLMIDDDTRRRSSREYRFGRMADELLAREGPVIDADSRARLVDAVAEARGDATLGLHRMADGNYNPDADRASLPSGAVQTVPFRSWEAR